MCESLDFDHHADVFFLEATVREINGQMKVVQFAPHERHAQNRTGHIQTYHVCFGNPQHSCVGTVQGWWAYSSRTGPLRRTPLVS